MHYSMIRCCVCFFCCMIVCQNALHAQQVSRIVYSSAGKSVTSSGLSLSYNIGESIVFTGIGSNILLTQGFEQADKDVLTIINSPKSLLNVNVFPNPVMDQLQIRINGDKEVISDLLIEVEDMVGKRIKTIPVFVTVSWDQTFSIDFFNLRTGVYMVRVSSQKEHLNKTFKVIKD